ncbi:VWA domain-containing protein [Thiosocius teredinicola]|uniref:VWA domain-containing protein n=1 Tax=Thiosocius teredinicola TaxID=1973002 RepID=UPI000990FE57
MFTEFHFLRPAWLGLLIPLAVLLWWMLRRQGDSEVWRRVVDPHLLSHLLVDGQGGRRRWPLVLLAFAWLLAVLALAGPVWQQLPSPVYQAQQYRVVVLDISVSMNAADVRPSRLARARFEILDLLRKAKEGQSALIAYGAEPFIVSPLTTDVATIAAQVPSLDTNLLPIGGSKRTDLALHAAGDLLAQADAPDGDIILVTDELESKDAAIKAAGQMNERGYRVSVLGVGTQKGAPIPMGNGGFAKDASGAIRLAGLDQAGLTSLAKAGGGTYVTATAGDSDIDALLPNDSRQRALVDAGQSENQAGQWQEEGPWLLLLVLPLAALAFRRGWLSPLLLLFVVLPSRDATALSWSELWASPDQQAIEAFKAGKAAEAAELFERPDWRAAAQYEAGNYEKALDALQSGQGGEVAYNQGNTLARLGRLEDAVAAYERALQAEPSNEDARHNRDLVKRLLEQQRSQQEQRQQPGNADNQQDGDAASPSQNGQDRQDGEKSQNASDQSSNGSGDSSEGDPSSASPQAESEQSSSAGQSKDDQQQNTQADGADKTEEQGTADEKGDQGDKPEAPSQQQANDSNKANKPGAGDTASTERRQAGAAPSNPSQMAPQNESNNNAPQASVRPSSAGQPNLDTRQQQPDIDDLLNTRNAVQRTPAHGSSQAINPEHQQAMEQMLRRVEDDPAGLLRQRFLLQHLRRHGRLPTGG